MRTLEDRYGRKVLSLVLSIQLSAGIGMKCTHRPVHHLAWVHREWTEQADQAIPEGGCGEGREDRSNRLNVGIIIQLITASALAQSRLKYRKTHSLDGEVHDRGTTVRCGGRNKRGNNMLRYYKSAQRR